MEISLVLLYRDKVGIKWIVVVELVTSNLDWILWLYFTIDIRSAIEISLIQTIMISRGKKNKRMFAKINNNEISVLPSKEENDESFSHASARFQGGIETRREALHLNK